MLSTTTTIIASDRRVVRREKILFIAFTCFHQQGVICHFEHRIDHSYSDKHAADASVIFFHMLSKLLRKTFVSVVNKQPLCVLFYPARSGFVRTQITAEGKAKQ